MPAIIPGRRVYQVRGGYLGTASGASVPAAGGRSPGDYFVITTAGGSYAVGDLAIVNASASGYDKLTPGSAYALKDGSDASPAATWRTTLDVPSTSDARRLAGQNQAPGIAFDGVAGTRILGSLPVAVGTDDFTLWARVLVPTSNPAVAVNLIGFPNASAATNSTGSTGLTINTSGGLSFAAVDGTNTMATTTLSTFISSFGGQWVDVFLARSSTSWECCINGVSVLTGTSTPGVVNITQTRVMVGGSFDSGTATYAGTVQRAALFNRRLTAAETLDLVRNGIHPADIGASFTPIVSATLLNGGFETLGAGGADVFGTWTETTSGTGVVSALTSGQYAGTNSLQLTRSSSGDSCSVTQSLTLVAGRRYRISCWARTPATGTLLLNHAPNSSSLQIVQALTSTWTRYAVEGVATSSTAGNLQVTLNTGTTGTVQVDNIIVERIGAEVDYEFGTGVGTYIQDDSGNALFAEIAGGGWWTRPVRGGFITYVRTLAHSDISSFAFVTKLFDLPPACGIVRVEFDRTTAFDAGVTLSVGITSAATKYVNSQSVAATGIVLVNSASLASESSSVPTIVYVQKSGSTTVGAVTVRVTVEIRG